MQPPNTPIYATYKGASDFDKAMQYLSVNRTGFSRENPHMQNHLAKQLVQEQQAMQSHVFLTGGAAAVESTANTAVGQLKGIIEGESFGGALKKAWDEDSAGVTGLFQTMLDAMRAGAAAVTKKDAPAEPLAASASSTRDERVLLLQGYPGPNNVAKGIVMLSEKQPGFKQQSFAEQNRIAGNWLQTGVAR